MATPSFKVSPRAQTSYRTLEGRGPTKGAPSLRKAIAAARSVTPHEGLDVERLARAMKEAEGVAWPTLWTVKPENLDWLARQVAAKYRALASTPASPETTDD